MFFKPEICRDWPIKNLNQSAGGHTNDQKTLARSLSDHLVKRGEPALNSAWNWNLNRQNSTSAYAIIDSGRFWTRYSRFQGEKSNHPCPCPEGSPLLNVNITVKLARLLRCHMRELGRPKILFVLKTSVTLWGATLSIKLTREGFTTLQGGD